MVNVDRIFKSVAPSGPEDTMLNRFLTSSKPTYPGPGPRIQKTPRAFFYFELGFCLFALDDNIGSCDCGGVGGPLIDSIST